MKGSGTFCAVANCRNCRKRALELDRPISFHRFPKNPELRKVWVENCRRPWEFKIDTSFICSDHFEESDFLRDLKAELLGLKQVKRLKDGAVPTLNLPPEVVEVPELGVSFNLREPQAEQPAQKPEPELVFEELPEIDPKINIADLDEFLLVDNLEELVGDPIFDEDDHYIILDISSPT